MPVLCIKCRYQLTGNNFSLIIYITNNFSILGKIGDGTPYRRELSEKVLFLQPDESYMYTPRRRLGFISILFPKMPLQTVLIIFSFIIYNLTHRKINAYKKIMTG